ncbi:MAG: chemotaxis protein CheA, partial [Gammaproteobacteria bacterium]
NTPVREIFRMAIDIDLTQFHEIFYEESLEGLGTMETGLLNLDIGIPDADVINTVFRAAHSIKGGAGTFGLMDIAQFTHIVETTLDDVRSRKRGVTQELVDVLLKSVDCLRYMINCSKTGTVADKERIAELAESLGQVESAAPSANNKIPVAVNSGWRIIFKPAPHLLQTGNEPYRLLRELNTLGELKVTADATGLPSFDQLEPELCYLGWDVLIRGDTSREQIGEIFAWVEGDCALEITLQGDRRLFVERRKGEREVLAEQVEAREAASIRVNIDKVDGLINLVGELVITQSILNRVAGEITGNYAEDLVEVVEILVCNTRELQDQAMRIRMLPIDYTFNRLPRLVRDLSRSLGKQVDLVITGNSTEVDKTVLEKISDPLIHLIRNAVDHGIEKPEDRLAAGKPEKGLIEISASQEGGNIIIKIVDDGAGLNQEKILAKARERGLVDQEELTPAQINNLIFQPGFSTAAEISSVSGRGVGMDVVKRNINDLGGNVELSSVTGKGTRFSIKLPLTLAILDGQLVRVGKETLIIPLLNIVESIQPNRDQFLEVTGETRIYHYRDQYLPIIRLYETFRIPTDIMELHQGLLVVTDSGEHRIALFVDEVLGQQQVVIKSLETNYRQVPGLSGATILGDGTVAMILDIASLTQFVRTTTHKQVA